MAQNMIYMKKRNYKVFYGPGKVSLGKGTKFFLECIQYLPKNINIYICGSGDMEWEIKRFIKKGTDHNVFYWNKLPIDKYKELMSQMDVTVSCSITSDTLPRVAIESLSFGIPVVATNEFGYTDIIDNGKNGYLVDVWKPEKVAEGICKILECKKIEKEYEEIELSKENKRKFFLMRKFKQEVKA